MTYSESDTRAKYIDPQLKKDGWEDSCVIREYTFTNGRKFVWGRGKQKYADYLLKYKWANLAIIEAKNPHKKVEDILEKPSEILAKLHKRNQSIAELTTQLQAML